MVKIIKAGDLDAAEARSGEARRSRPMSEGTSVAVRESISEASVRGRIENRKAETHARMEACFRSAAADGAVYEDHSLDGKEEEE